MKTNNLRLPRKDEENQRMLGDWCWSLRKVSNLFFTLRCVWSRMQNQTDGAVVTQVFPRFGPVCSFLHRVLIGYFYSFLHFDWLL